MADVNQGFYVNRSIEIASDVAFEFFSFSEINEWKDDGKLDYISNRFKIYTNAIKITDELFRETSWLCQVIIGDQSRVVPINSDVTFENVDIIDTPFGKGFTMKIIPYKYETLQKQLLDYRDQTLSNSIGQGRQHLYYVGVNKRENDETQG